MIKRTSKGHIQSILSEKTNWKILDIGCGYSANELATTICDVQDLSKFYKDKNFIKELTTNSDGRTDQNLLNSEEFFFGHFELNFHVGEYLKSNINNFPNLQGLLYDVIPIKFTIFSDRNYHIPLLLSPFGYSTYLGS